MSDWRDLTKKSNEKSGRCFIKEGIDNLVCSDFEIKIGGKQVIVNYCEYLGDGTYILDWDD